MRKIFIPFVVLMTVLLTSSCSSIKKYSYFNNIDTLDLSRKQPMFDARIMPKDLLSISVSTTNPEASKPFTLNSENLRYGGGYDRQSLLDYLVDNEGYIDFPVIGRIRVVGLTKNECQDLIKKKIAPYLSSDENPVVTVRMSSFRVTVIGEVGGARVIPVNTEKMSIIEAIASAGDLGAFGKRSNVLLIREDADGNRTTHRFNLNDANLFNSPYYYVQQNDIIYVQASKLKISNTYLSATSSFWYTIIGLLTSTTTLVLTLTK